MISDGELLATGSYDEIARFGGVVELWYIHYDVTGMVLDAEI